MIHLLTYRQTDIRKSESGRKMNQTTLLISLMARHGMAQATVKEKALINRVSLCFLPAVCTTHFYVRIGGLCLWYLSRSLEEAKFGKPVKPLSFGSSCPYPEYPLLYRIPGVLDEYSGTFIGNASYGKPTTESNFTDSMLCRPV